MSEVIDFTNTGRILRCYSPVLLGGGRNAAGDIVLNWTRRTRVGGAWLNGTEVPLGEASEQYTLNWYSAAYAALLGSDTSATPTFTLTVARQTTLYGGAVAVGDLHWGVQQVGALGAGYEARAIT